MKRVKSPPDLCLPPHIEEKINARGLTRIAGVDEVGRGPLAGPVVAAAVLLPLDLRLPDVNDSKLITPRRRERLYEAIRASALAVCVRWAEPEEIDRINILEASRRAMREAVLGLPELPELALVDGLPVPNFPVEHIAVVKGDSSCLAIAAASIIAKVERDRMMRELDRVFPRYGFSRHKGYGTKEHLERLREHGPCPAHRHSFSPVRAFLRSPESGIFLAFEGAGSSAPSAEGSEAETEL
jgi:ribonuclease HII